LDKNAILTIRIPRATRRRIEDLAKRQGRSISGAAERLIELGLAQEATGASLAAEGAATRAPALAGCLAGGVVPTMDDFRDVRTALSESLMARVQRHAKPRR